MELAAEWEEHRAPLLERIRAAGEKREGRKARAVAKIQRRWRARQNARFFRRREIARGLSSRGGRELETTI
mgnify:CR=1 FL=1